MNYSVTLTTLKQADVVVIGGGAAGTCAAIASARNGASTLLIEQHGCLGGMMTLGLVMPLSAQATKGGQSFGGILHELLERIIALTKEYCGGVGKPHHLFSSPHIMKYVLLDTAVNSGVADSVVATSDAPTPHETRPIMTLAVMTQLFVK